MKTQHIRLLLLFTLSQLFFLSSQAQLNWTKARVHFVSGEQRDLEVREFISARVPQKIRYRVEKGSKSQICNPRDIVLLDFEGGKRFMRVKTKIDLTPINMNKLKDFFDHEQVDTTLLVTELVRGKYSLYYFLDINGKIIFSLAALKFLFMN